MKYSAYFIHILPVKFNFFELKKHFFLPKNLIMLMNLPFQQVNKNKSTGALPAHRPRRP